MRRLPTQSSASRQRGLVLFIALIVLVAMTLAGIGMMRSVDTATLVAGNLAFKQSAAHSADEGIDAATNWLLPRSSEGGDLHLTSLADGYCSAQAGCGLAVDVNGNPNWASPLSWENEVCLNGCKPDAAGNIVSYVIHRMCVNADADWTTQSDKCATYDPNLAAGKFQSEGESNLVYKTGFDTAGGGGNLSIFFRITARSRGPRDTVSIVQSMVVMPE